MSFMSSYQITSNYHTHSAHILQQRTCVAMGYILCWINVQSFLNIISLSQCITLLQC